MPITRRSRSSRRPLFLAAYGSDSSTPLANSVVALASPMLRGRSILFSLVAWPSWWNAGKTRCAKSADMNRRHLMPFGAEVCDDGSVRFRLWAPAAKRVDLILEAPSSPSVPLGAVQDGWFE